MKKLLGVLAVLLVVSGCAVSGDGASPTASAPEDTALVEPTNTETVMPTDSPSAEPTESANEGGISASPEASSSDEPPSQVSGKTLLEWMKKGTYTFSFEATSETSGTTTQSSGTYVVQGSKVSMTVTQNVNGVDQTARMVVDGDYIYAVMDSIQTVYRTKMTDEMKYSGYDLNFTKMKKGKSGKEKFETMKLEYTDYTVNSTTNRVYLRDGDVYAIVSDTGASVTTMKIYGAAGRASADAFHIPTDYTMTDQ
jgi:hypothetical protein